MIEIERLEKLLKRSQERMEIFTGDAAPSEAQKLEESIQKGLEARLAKAKRAALMVAA